MFTTVGDIDCVERHAVDEARKRRREANNECNNTAPVCRISGRIAVHAMEVIHVRDRHIATSGDIITERHALVSSPML
jgi:hypothetical protein